jgi:hypothetical protein
MKKNNMMRIASVLLVAVLMSTCAISGTFAKYVTSANSSDSARVAKFGVVITANGNIFAADYNGKVTAEGGTPDVVAPGTSGKLASMTLSGKPEVSVEVTYTGTVQLTGWTNSNGKFYCPVKVNVAGTNLCGLDYATSADFITAIQDNIASYSKTYAPNTDLSTVGIGAESLKISWEWAYEDATTYLNGAQQNDTDDTFLGDQAAAGNASTILISLVTTVTQVD